MDPQQMNRAKQLQPAKQPDLVVTWLGNQPGFSLRTQPDGANVLRKDGLDRGIQQSKKPDRRSQSESFSPHIYAPLVVLGKPHQYYNYMAQASISRPS
ncbi:hypothetical protein DTO207G8_6235 [Paecilomyces variotii]|nr:hypothetical protein DTO207G8_6235 [Paecilomyces variotii]